MKFSATFVALSLIAIRVQAHELPSRYAAARRGNQFVTGACSVDSDCQQGCCGFATGKCAGPAVAQSNGSGGCGHGTAAPNCNVASALGLSDCIAGAKNGNLADPAVQTAAAFVAKLDNLPFTPSAGGAAPPAAAAPPPAAAAPQSVPQLAALQTSKKTVFEACANDSECQQGCCGFTSGKCAGPAVAQTNGSGGCGHSTAAPNCNVASALKLSDCIAGAKNGNLGDAGIQAAAAFVSQLDNLPFTPSAGGAAPPAAAAPPPAAAAPKSVPQLAALQTSKKTVFETCANDSECQQGCCGFTSGKCAGPAVAQTNGSGGCGHSTAAPNCNVASALKLSDCIAGAQNGNLADAGIQAAAAFVSQLDNLPFTPARR
ncbi:hypothetical protein C8R46DRAFT_1343360 [Mycena filopes]|nr:hypothetical protein C8R46DRAFT_1343360 [Mycena filopes]